MFPLNRYTIDDSQLVESHLTKVSKPNSEPASASPSEQAVTPVQQPQTVLVNHTCPTCGSFLGGNPLDKEGVIPAHLAYIFAPVPCKPQPVTRKKLVTEARVLTSGNFHKKLQQRHDENIKRKEEIQKRKIETEERKNRKKHVVKKPNKNKSPVVPASGPPSDYIDICMKCQQVDPASIEDGDDFKWIECDNCGQWYHTICVSIVPELVDDLEEHLRQKRLICKCARITPSLTSGFSPRKDPQVGHVWFAETFCGC